MVTTTVVLVLLGLLCFLAAAFNVSVHPRVSLIALGLAFITLAQFLPLVS